MFAKGHCPKKIANNKKLSPPKNITQIKSEIIGLKETVTNDTLIAHSSLDCHSGESKRINLLWKILTREDIMGPYRTVE